MLDHGLGSCRLWSAGPFVHNSQVTPSPTTPVFPGECSHEASLLPSELSGEISRKVNLILNRFLNQLPRDRDPFAFHLFFLSHLGWYFTRIAGIFRVLSRHGSDPQSMFLKGGSHLKMGGGAGQRFFHMCDFCLPPQRVSAALALPCVFGQTYTSFSFLFCVLGICASMAGG